jgi:hypothetical protein
VDIGGESRGYGATANRGSRGGACGEAAAPGEVSNPGGRQMDEDDGAIMSSARSAPALAVVASKAGMAMPKRGVLAPLEISSTDGQLPWRTETKGKRRWERTPGPESQFCVCLIFLANFLSARSVLYPANRPIRKQ